MPSITVSPIVATSPPMSSRVDDDLHLDVLVRRPAQRRRRARCTCASSSGDRRTHLGDLVLTSLRRELDEAVDDRGEVVPTARTDDERRERTGELQASGSRAARRRSRRAARAGMPGLASAIRRSSLPSTMRANRNSSSSTSSRWPSAATMSSSACAYDVDAIRPRSVTPATWSMKLSTSWRLVSSSRLRSTIRPARSIDSAATSVRSCAMACVRWFAMSA